MGAHMSEKTILESRLYDLFYMARGMVEHEDSLVNSRLMWVLTFSGFLFATYGGSLIAEASLLKNVISDNMDGTLRNFSTRNQIDMTRSVLSIVGVLSCIVGANSIAAAHSAIRRIVKKYGSFVVANKGQIESEGVQVWKLIGDAETNVAGFQLALALPYILAMSWSILLIANSIRVLFPSLDGGFGFYIFCGFSSFIFWFGLARIQNGKVVKEGLNSNEAKEVTEISIKSFSVKLEQQKK